MRCRDIFLLVLLETVKEENIRKINNFLIDRLDPPLGIIGGIFYALRNWKMTHNKLLTV